MNSFICLCMKLVLEKPMDGPKPTSCNRLKQFGHLKNGFYTVKPYYNEKRLRTIYCDFTKANLGNKLKFNQQHDLHDYQIMMNSNFKRFHNYWLLQITKRPSVTTTSKRRMVVSTFTSRGTRILLLLTRSSLTMLHILISVGP